MRNNYEVDDTSMDHSSTDHSDSPRRRLSRRGFLGAAGAGVGAAALATGAGPVGAHLRDGGGGRGGGRDRDRNRDRNPKIDGGGADDAAPARFGRMFPGLAPFAQPSDGLTEALIELGRPGGILDANDPLEEGPIRLITNPELSPNNRDNPTHTAGTTFMGQFLDHDITRDAGSTLGRPQSVRRSTNLSTPRFDLDTVYGGGPTETPDLFTTDPIRFRVESGGLFEDLPRDAAGQAIIGDPRNDENMMISGIQVAFLLFHNAVAERVEATGLSGIDAFEETRRLVRWHWQWIIIREFLPQIISSSLLNEMATTGPQFLNQAQIPVEFQGAAYRFGHSMVRPSYRANLAGDNGEAFFAFIFNPDRLEGPDPDTLLGGFRAPRRFIGWQTFFDFDDGEVRPNKRIDRSLSTPLFQLPIFTIDGARAEDPGPISLATRNLLRHITWQQPSGQAVAQLMNVGQLGPADLAELAPLGASLDTSTPLWYYVLAEAELMTDGLQLGPVGGRIVAEVFTVLLAEDPTSFPGSDPGWTPTLPSALGVGEFRMTDLLTLAGVDPQSRGQ